MKSNIEKLKFSALVLLRIPALIGIWNFFSSSKYHQLYPITPIMLFLCFISAFYIYKERFCNLILFIEFFMFTYFILFYVPHPKIDYEGLILLFYAILLAAYTFLLSLYKIYQKYRN